MKKRNIKVNEQNSIVFNDGDMFIYTNIIFEDNKINYKGIYLNKITPNTYMGYKNSFISLEVSFIRSFIWYVLSLLSKKKTINNIIKEYINKYNNSKIVHICFSDVIQGELIGEFKTSESKNSKLRVITFEDLINKLNKQNFQPNKYEYRTQSFKNKCYSQVLYKKIS